MDKRSILFVFVILMALSLTLSAVSAADNATNDAVVASDAPAVAAAPADIVDDSNQDTAAPAAGGDENLAAPAAPVSAATPRADIGVEVSQFEDYGDFIIWQVFAYNLGPDAAVAPVVYVHLSDNLAYFMDFELDQSQFLPISDNYGIWVLNDLQPFEFSYLWIATVPLDEGPFFVEAFAISQTEDPDWSNNYDIAYARADSTPVDAEVLPEAGNPIAIALLGLMAIGVGGLRRKI